jgi:hypothetical protein
MFSFEGKKSMNMAAIFVSSSGHNYATTKGYSWNGNRIVSICSLKYLPLHWQGMTR